MAIFGFLGCVLLLFILNAWDNHVTPEQQESIDEYKKWFWEQKAEREAKKKEREEWENNNKKT
jgi:hypothetical protein